MGTEMAQNGWWHTDEWHRLNWDNAQDDIGAWNMHNTAVLLLPQLYTQLSPALLQQQANGSGSSTADSILPVGHMCKAAVLLLPLLYMQLLLTAAGQAMVAACSEQGVLADMCNCLSTHVVTCCSRRRSQISLMFYAAATAAAAAAAAAAGRGMMAAVADVNKLRMSYPVLRYGWSNCIHEDRANGIMG
jgi:hypothetical protein